MITFDELRYATRTRQKEWFGDESPGLEFRTIELSGEAGELANAIKKLLRERKGARGSKVTLEDIADELGDVVICCENLADELGIDLGHAVARKFNKTSEKYDLKTRI